MASAAEKRLTLLHPYTSLFPDTRRLVIRSITVIMHHNCRVDDNNDGVAI